MPRSHLPQRPIGSKCLGPIEVIGPPQHYFHDCTNEAATYVRVNCHTGYVLNLWKLKTVNAPQPGKGRCTVALGITVAAIGFRNTKADTRHLQGTRRRTTRWPLHTTRVYLCVYHTGRFPKISFWKCPEIFTCILRKEYMARKKGKLGGQRD